jgi:hypothetical protein
MSSAAPRERTHTLFVLKQPGQPDRLIVWDTQDVSVGRSPENDICIDHGELSRRHAVFSRLKDAFVVKNMSMSNGTLVNGEAVQTHALKPKDVVRMADVEMHFHQTTRNPATLGGKLEYASQLKDFGPAGGAGANPDSTMLGLMDEVDDGEDDDFEVRPASDFAYDLHNMELEKGAAPRNLDLELDAPAPETAAAPARDEVWALDEVPAPAEGGPLTLQLEIDGLSGDLRRHLESLLGKTLELPALRIRVKGRDLP